jgi:prolyl oligopeptidase
MKRAVLAVLLLVSACTQAPAPVVMVSATPAPAVVAAPVLPPPPPPPPQLPAAARVDATADVYFGQSVADPYRWLENAADPEVQAWTRTETAYAHAWIAQLPERPAVLAQLRALSTVQAAPSYTKLINRNGQIFAIKTDPRRPRPLLVVMPTPERPNDARTIIDLAQLDPQGRTNIDWYVPSNDGTKVAVSLSLAGSEAGDLRVFDVATGRPLPDMIPRVQSGTAGGDLAWLDNDSGFYYTRYPRPGERAPADMGFYVQIYQHALGADPAADTYVFGREAPRIAEYRLLLDRPTERLLITVQDGDSNRFAHWMRARDGRITRVADFSDKIVELVFGRTGRLYGISWARDPKGEIIALPAGAPTAAQARRIIAPGEAALSHSFYNPTSPTLLVRASTLFAVYQTGGPTEIRAFDLNGRPVGAPQQQPVSAVSGLTEGGLPGVLFTTASYLDSPRWMVFDPATGATRPSALTAAHPPENPDITVVREFATSKDGARIPINILMPRGATTNGVRAIVVTGYGGFGISRTPEASRQRRILFDNGIVFAEANLRGGSEFGDAWHQAGMLTRKQNVFDDFIAVVEHLTNKGYGARDRVAIMGGSNGGLLVGAVAVQRPELFQAVVARSGIFDSLRNELDANGLFNAVEFGSVRDPAQFAALRAYSPYHRVRNATGYPAFLFLTSANDPRVNPMHSRKFTARLRAAQAPRAEAPPNQILLLEQAEGGHGVAGSGDDALNQAADQYAFLFNALRVVPGSTDGAPAPRPTPPPAAPAPMPAPAVAPAAPAPVP